MTCRELATTAYGPIPTPTTASRFAGRFVGLWRAYLNRRAQWATVRVLRSLDARTLKDIGMDPTEIESVVHGRREDRRRR